MSVSVVLPTYNESHNIVQVVKEILAVLPKDSECLVVDDDSPDGTGKLVQTSFTKNPQVRLFIRQKEKGLGTAILFGLQRARKPLVVIMDSDFNHQPKYLPLFLRHLKGADFVCGSRYVKGGDMPETPVRFWGSYLFNLYIRLLLHSPVKDSLSGFVAVRKSVIDRLTTQEKRAIFSGFGEWYIRLLWWAKTQDLRLKEIPVKYGSRLGDQSKMNFARSIVDYTKTVLQLRQHGLSL
jgi:dolichol-phosphate mannosyltransferase